MELVIGLAGTLAGRNGTTRRPPKRLERRSYALHKGKAFAFPDREAAHRTRTPTVLAHVCGARVGLGPRPEKSCGVSPTPEPRRSPTTHNAHICARPTGRSHRYAAEYLHQRAALAGPSRFLRPIVVTMTDSGDPHSLRSSTATGGREAPARD